MDIQLQPLVIQQPDRTYSDLAFELARVKGIAIGTLEHLRREHLPKCAQMMARSQKILGFSICVCGAESTNAAIDRAVAQLKESKQ